MNQKIAIFGAAFNPPHLGHIDIIKKLDLEFDLVYLIPSFNHAFGKKMMPFDFRIDLIKNACLEFNLLNPIVSSIEKDISVTKKTDEAIFTYEILDTFKKLYPNDEIYFALGPDNYDISNFKKFKNYQYILDNFKLYPVEEKINIRSTICRAIIKNTDIYNLTTTPDSWITKMGKYTSEKIFHALQSKALQIF